MVIMADVDTERQNYVKDPRIACKYGAKCYQKNPIHLNKYKHPPQKRKNNDNSQKNENKKPKLNESVESIKETVMTDSTSDSNHVDGSTEDNKNEIKISNDISDSDSSSLGTEEESKEVDNKKLDSENISKVYHQVTSSKESESNNFDNSNDNDISKNVENVHIKDNEVNGKILDPHKFIKEKFLVVMPQDFFKFWELCKTFNKTNPVHAFKDFGLKLVGPYDVLAGKFDNAANRSEEEYLIHWRYYFDPPQVQTVVKGDDKTGFHIGYFREAPDQAPVMVVGNHGLKDGEFTPMGDNIFAAMSLHLEDLKKSTDPFKKMQLCRYQAAIKNEAAKIKLELSQKSAKMKKRDAKVLTRTFNKIGLVVPYNRKTQLGYRELAMGAKELKTLLNKIQTASPQQKGKYLSDLQDLLTATDIAIDECDFGTGLELGLNVLAHGVDSLNGTISRFLSNCFKLLKQERFAKIAEAHMANRRKDTNLSIV